MFNIIDRIEKYGYPEPQPIAHCPWCGAECETFYKARGEIIGCEYCVKKLDAVEESERMRDE